MQQTKTLVSLLFGTTLSLTWQLSWAQQNADDWQVIIGAGAELEREYPGSEDYSLSPLPLVDIRRGRWFLSTEDGLGVTLFQSELEPEYRLGIAVALGEDEREENDADRLEGLGDVDMAIEAQLFAEFEVGFADVELTLAQDLGSGHEGFWGELETSITPFVREGFRLSMGPSLRFADATYTEAFYGIDSDQARRSGFDQYDASAGLLDVSFEVEALWEITPHWLMLGSVGYAQLLGDAADSPIVEREGSIEAMLLLGYRF